MKKRFLSIVLAVLMLLSVLPVTAMAADRTTVNTAQNGIEATKTAKWVNEKEGIAEITITVKGEPPEVSTPEVDAVLVIDLSGSMNDNNKLNDAKAAAKKFVDKFFGTSAPASYKKSVRIAVVGYNGYAEAYADLTEAKNADALYTLFGSGYGSLSAGGGTNIQDGIYRAQQILKNGRAGAKKVMVVLSDGEPTYSFDANVAHTFGQNEETYGVKKNNFLYVVSEIDHTDRVGSGSAYATGDYHYYYYCKDDKNVQQQLNDSGWRITNEVLGDATELPPAGKPHASVTITPEALKNYEIHVSADKYVKSVKGTFNKDEEDVDFTFAVSSDKRGKNELDRFDITVDESVKAGETSSRFDGGITIRLTEEEFDDLKWETFEGDGKKYPVVYLREVKGSDKKMRYDTSVVTLYLLVPQVIVTSHDPIYKTTSLNAWVDPTDSTLWPEFTNVYGKESSSSDTVKVGPQLNRDDHVAYIMGYPDGTVQPKGEITRAEACTIFFRLLTDSSRDYYFSKTNDYTDVNAGDWFNNAISTLSNAGIVTGYNDGTFRPNQPITRGEMAKIIANFANLNKGTKSFTDLSGHWSKSYVELAAGNGWIAGYPDGSFRPDQKITRAETVTMINRVLERVPAKELRLLSRSIMLTFPDNNPGDWYYIAIQEASNSHEYQRSVYETTGDEMWTKLIDNVDWTKLEK